MKSLIVLNVYHLKKQLRKRKHEGAGPLFIPRSPRELMRDLKDEQKRKVDDDSLGSR